jgi:hypothetical protein
MGTIGYYPGICQEELKEAGNLQKHFSQERWSPFKV